MRAPYPQIDPETGVYKILAYHKDVEYLPHEKETLLMMIQAQVKQGKTPVLIAADLNARGSIQFKPEDIEALIKELP